MIMGHSQYMQLTPLPCNIECHPSPASLPSGPSHRYICGGFVAQALPICYVAQALPICYRDMRASSTSSTRMPQYVPAQ
jgi:hypothetical protein